MTQEIFEADPSEEGPFIEIDRQCYFIPVDLPPIDHASLVASMKRFAAVLDRAYFTPIVSPPRHFSISHRRRD